MTEPLRGPIRLTELPAGWSITAVAETGSTNADLLAGAGTGAPDRTVLVADLQTGGRGRLDRSWVSPAGAGLTFSVLLRPTAPVHTWAWLPLLAGLALRTSLGEVARLKWPNDVLLGPQAAKVAGLLAQTGAGAVVLGVGLNVSTTAAELPVPTATSLALQGYSVLDRTLLLGGFLTALAGLIERWQACGGDAAASGLAEQYRSCCATLGEPVSVELPAGRVLGEAIGIDPDGRLLLRPADGGATLAVAAGDVTHVRAISR